MGLVTRHRTVQISAQVGAGQSGATIGRRLARIGRFNEPVRRVWVIDTVDVAALWDEVQSLNLTSTSWNYLHELQIRLHLAITQIRNDPDEDEGLADDLMQAQHLVVKLIAHYQKHEDETKKLEKLEKIEERIDELEKTQETFRSVRSWATALFVIVLVGWTLISADGRPTGQRVAIYAVALVIGLLWRFIWKY